MEGCACLFRSGTNFQNSKVDMRDNCGNGGGGGGHGIQKCPMMAKQIRCHVARMLEQPHIFFGKNRTARQAKHTQVSAVFGAACREVPRRDWTGCMALWSSGLPAGYQGLWTRTNESGSLSTECATVWGVWGWPNKRAQQHIWTPEMVVLFFGDSVQPPKKGAPKDHVGKAGHGLEAEPQKGMPMSGW